MDECLLAFDIGTTGNKASLVDAVTGHILASATAGYPTYYTEDGGAEQSPGDWWQSAITCCAKLAAVQPEALQKIAAIAAGGMMNGLVLVDAKGQALRPAIIHADVRSAAQCRRLEQAVGAQAIFRATANRPDPHLTLPKAMWLCRAEPALVSQAAYIIQAKDYLAGQLSGVYGITDPSDASLTGGFDVANRAWVTDLWETAGVPVRLLPEVIPSTQVVGVLTQEAAEALGLRAGIPVVMGGGDGACASAGSGAATGQAYNYLGGTSWIGLILDTPLADDRLSSYCALDERVTTFGTVQAAGTSVEWLGQILGIGATDFARMDDLATRVEPGAHNLFFLPYLQGERAPLWDVDARGAFFGLSTINTRAHLFRAVVEGVTFALRSILDVFSQNGYPLDSIRMLGGGAGSSLWQSVLSGVYGRELCYLFDVSSATSLGAAMAAGVGVDVYPSIAEAAKLVSIAQTQPVDTLVAKAYAPRYAFFQTLYPALKERYAALAKLSDLVSSP